MERIKSALDKARKDRVLRTRQLSAPVDAPYAPSNTLLDYAAPDAEFAFTETPVLALDKQGLSERGVVLPESRSKATDIYRMLRTLVLQRMGSRRARTLAICSPGAGEGKTVTAVNLAINMALTGNRTVMLVDLNLRDPGVATCLGVTPEFGLDSYLSGNADLSQCLFSPGIDRLSILPVSQAVEGSSELIASHKMRLLAQELRNRYPDRIIIYDTSPLLTTDDCLVFEPHLDTYLLVVREGVTEREDVVRAIELLGMDKFIGTVLNHTL